MVPVTTHQIYLFHGSHGRRLGAPRAPSQPRQQQHLEVASSLGFELVWMIKVWMILWYFNVT